MLDRAQQIGALGALAAPNPALQYWTSNSAMPLATWSGRQSNANYVSAVSLVSK